MFGRGQIVTGIAMLSGSAAGGFIAEQTSLGVPFVLRGVILIAMFGVAFKAMHDIGFSPQRGGRPLAEMRKITSNSIEYGWRVPAVKWLMVEALFTGASASTPSMPCSRTCWSCTGTPTPTRSPAWWRRSSPAPRSLGGIAAPRIRRLFHRRTSALLVMAAASVVALGLIGFVESFWAVIGAIVVWGLLFAATMPIRQAYINGLIPSQQRATILSFDSMMSSGGGVWTQPLLGRAADAWGYAPSYLIGAGISVLAIPCLALSRRENAAADTVEIAETEPVSQPG